MSPPAAADPPIAIDRVERDRSDGSAVRLRLSGRWLGEGHPGEHEALLVVQLHGRRHRFPATNEPVGDRAILPGNWQADFTVPSWAVPTRRGQAAVWIGNAVVAVGPPGRGRDAPSVPPTLAAASPRAPQAELEARAVQADAELSAARWQIESLQERLGAHAGSEQRAVDDAESLREQLAAAQIARDAAISEAGGLRGELERLGAELAVMREQVTAYGGDLGEAERLLADARALTEQLRGETAFQ